MFIGRANRRSPFNFMEIPQEQFDYQSTLADIGVQIAKGRAELAALATQKEEFLQMRELELSTRLEAMLKLSAGALTEAMANRKVLTTWQNELIDFNNTLTNIAAELNSFYLDADNKLTTTLELLDNKRLELNSITSTHKLELGIINTQKAELAKQNRLLDNQQKKINSQQQVLTNAFNEARKRKIL